MARCALVPGSGLGPALSYGLSPQIEAFSGWPVRVVRGSGRANQLGTTPVGVDPEDLLTAFEGIPGSPLRTAFAFGGSTTAGGDCSPLSSSWPAELSVLVPGMAILNFARPGTDSEYSVVRLQMELSQQESDFRLLAHLKRPEFLDGLDQTENGQLAHRAPGLVFWANWANERNRMVEDRQVNFDRTELPEEYRLPQASSSAVLLFHRLHISLQRRSVFWLGLARWGEDAVGPNPLSNWTGFDPAIPLDEDSERAIGSAVEYTLSHLRRAHGLTKRLGSQLVVVRPPMSWALFEANSGREHTVLTRRWNHVLFEQVTELSTKLGVSVLDVHGWLEGHETRLEYFCDGAHMTLLGHQYAARGLQELGVEAGLF